MNMKDFILWLQKQKESCADEHERNNVPDYSKLFHGTKSENVQRFYGEGRSIPINIGGKLKKDNSDGTE